MQLKYYSTRDNPVIFHLSELVFKDEGKRNVKETDQQLRQDVLELCAAQTFCAGRELHVGVMNSIVHLSGSLASCEDRSMLEQMVSSLAGVRGVVNRIEAPGAPVPARNIRLDITGSELVE